MSFRRRKKKKNRRPYNTKQEKNVTQKISNIKSEYKRKYINTPKRNN